MLYLRKFIFMFFMVIINPSPHLSVAAFATHLMFLLKSSHKAKPIYFWRGKKHQQESKTQCCCHKQTHNISFPRRMCFMSYEKPQKRIVSVVNVFKIWPDYFLRVLFKLGELFEWVSIQWKSEMLRHIILITQFGSYHRRVLLLYIHKCMCCQPSEVLFIVCDKQNNANIFIAW